MSGVVEPDDEINEKKSPFFSAESGDSLSAHPINEAEDFYDPFSDLNLYLSKKIRGEIQKSGSPKNWSSKIEASLLAKILPEFKEKFPKYRLGARALKKVWEKVSYYYEKLQGQKEALQEDGKLNLKLMIRENLRSASPLRHLPPYAIAQQIAVKISECIAALEGKRPQMDHLTRMIWSVQKHLIRDLSPLQAKSPYDEYDKLDKLIVKAQLEHSSQKETLAPHVLKKAMVEELKSYQEVKTLSKESQLTSTLSMILAEKLYSSSLINCHFSLKERKTIEAFVKHQIEMGKFNSQLNTDEHRLELIQRILALYTIAEELPKEISEKELREWIEKLQALSGEKGTPLPADIDQSLYVFITAELHLLPDSEEGVEPILKAYQISKELPKLSPSQLEQFELLIWKMIEEEGNLLSYAPTQTRSLLEKELGNALIEHPNQSFRMLVSTTLQFFKKVLPLSFEEKDLEEKIDPWVSQNDMLIRTVHFDPKTPLLKLIESKWKALNQSEDEIDHDFFIYEVEKEVLKTYPILSSFEEELRVRLWILYKYLWYHILPDGSTSTFDRFKQWHSAKLKKRHPEWSVEKIEAALTKLTEQLVPFAP